MKKSHILLACLGFFGIAGAVLLSSGMTRCHAVAQRSSATTPELSAEADTACKHILTAEEWADSVMKTMTPRQRIAQLFFPRWETSASHTPVSVIDRDVVKEGVGGFLLGKGSAAEYANIINRAQGEAAVPLMVTLDGEWGASMRVTDAPRFPKNIALGAIQDPSLLEKYGREVAEECKILGIQVDFAPVLDVNSNPDNPVIGIRSFGEDPNRVASLGAAYCRGMESAGVMAVGKHFPGHGDTSVDSHKTLPTVNHNVKTLESVDFVPFKAAIKSGISGMMVGHLRVPALDKNGTPASLSKKITTDILRNKLGFEGLIFTDALAMKGADTPHQNNAVSAFMAGADILLQPRSLSHDIQAMVDAVASGKISQEEVDSRCRRLLVYKHRLGLSAPVIVDKSNLKKRLDSPAAEALLGELSKASITVLRNENDILPLSDIEKKNIAVISLGAPSANAFVSTCSRYTSVASISVNASSEIPKALKVAEKADVVVVGVMKNNNITREAYSRILKCNPEVVGAFFVNPFKLSSFGHIDSTPCVIMAYDDTPGLLDAAAQAIFGGIDVTGRFPVNVKGVGKLGEGISLKKKD